MTTDSHETTARSANSTQTERIKPDCDSVEQVPRRTLDLDLNFFKVRHHIEDLVCRSSQLADDLTIVGIVLTLELASRLIDVSQALRHALTLGISYPKDPSNGGRLVDYFTPTQVTISMPSLTGMSHGCLDGCAGSEPALVVPRGRV
jgi:hypothetical protein